MRAGGSAGDRPYAVVLGIAQDAGYPQAGCRLPCCAAAWADPLRRRRVVCLAVVDPVSRQRWLLDCTPDFREQLHALDRMAPPRTTPGINGILLTHAHVGHYAGLLHLGREGIGAKGVSVFAMPRMRRFLEDNAPWSRLVTSQHIELREIAAAESIALNERIQVTAFLVPHRDELSETVGFRVQGPTRSAVYLPDIDDWDAWDTKIEDVITAADVAYLDGTFYSDEELPGRNFAEIPHPSIVASITRLAGLPPVERDKVRFLHFNHTNPLLDPAGSAIRTLSAAGHHAAVEGERFEL